MKHKPFELVHVTVVLKRTDVLQRLKRIFFHLKTYRTRLFCHISWDSTILQIRHEKGWL